MPEFSMVWNDGKIAEHRILTLIGPFTLAAVFEFQNAVRQNTAPVTVIDLTGVPYMDSAALGSLLGLHVSCQQHSRRYALGGVSDRLRTMLRVAGVDSVLHAYASLGEAEAALGTNAASA